MLGKEDWMTIKSQVEQGLYLKAIAYELDVHPKTIRRALDRGGPPRNVPVLERASSIPSRCTLTSDSRTRFAMPWSLSVRSRRWATQGGITILRIYIKPRRPARIERQTVRFETEPGVHLRNDGKLIWAW